MLTKKFLAGGLALVMVLGITACGKSGKEETELVNNEVESTPPQMEEYTPEEEYMPEDLGIEEDFANEEICAIYYAYMFGEASESEISETLEFYGKSLDDAKAIFDEHGEEYGYKIYEMSEEIKNSKIGDDIMQVGDSIIHFPCTLGEMLDSTGGELITDGVSKANRAFQEEYMYPCAESLDTFFDWDSCKYAMIKTPDESFLYCSLSIPSDGEIERARDAYVKRVLTGSNNVYLAGGIHTGLSMEEVDEVFSANIGGGSYNNWSRGNNSVAGDPYLVICADKDPDVDWETVAKQVPVIEVYSASLTLKIDSEGVSVYSLCARFTDPNKE